MNLRSEREVLRSILPSLLTSKIALTETRKVVSVLIPGTLNEMSGLVEFTITVIGWLLAVSEEKKARFLY